MGVWVGDGWLALCRFTSIVVALGPLVVGTIITQVRLLWGLCTIGVLEGASPPIASGPLWAVVGVRRCWTLGMVLHASGVVIMHHHRLVRAVVIHGEAVLGIGLVLIVWARLA